MYEYDCNLCGKHVTKHGNARTGKYCSRPCSAEGQRRERRPVTREWLYQKYVVEGLNAPDIAKIVKRNSKKVWFWLNSWDIPTRSRGTNPKVWFKKGNVSHVAVHGHTDETKEKIKQQTIARGGVPYLVNGVHHLKGKKGADTPNWKGGITPERTKAYASNEWKEVVKQVWARDNAICQRCELDHRTIDRVETSFHIHHIESFAIKEKRYLLTNLVLVCDKCHRWIHSRENTKKEYLDD